MVITSLWEGFGLVAFEALSLGLPVVCSNVGGLPSIVDDACGKLCNTEEDFLFEINRLIREQDYYLSKRHNAIKRSETLNNEHIYYDKLQEIYEK